jgi:hypothetical protein
VTIRGAMIALTIVLSLITEVVAVAQASAPWSLEATAANSHDLIVFGLLKPAVVRVCLSAGSSYPVIGVFYNANGGNNGSNVLDTRTKTLPQCVDACGAKVEVWKDSRFPGLGTVTGTYDVLDPAPCNP